MLLSMHAKNVFVHVRTPMIQIIESSGRRCLCEMIGCECFKAIYSFCHFTKCIPSSRVKIINLDISTGLNRTTDKEFHLRVSGYPLFC